MNTEHDLEAIIRQAPHVLVEFLTDLGLAAPQSNDEFRRLVPALSEWTCNQVVRPEDTAYLASRLGAFICEYLRHVHAAAIVTRAGRITVLVPVQQGVVREVDPFGVGWMIAVHGRPTLSEFLEAQLGPA